MIRFVGALLLTIGSGVLGGAAAAQLEGRVRDLRGVICGLEAMKRLLAASLEPLEGMLNAAVQETEGRPQKLFVFCSKEIKKQRRGNFAELWRAALDTVPFRLEETDLTELRQLGQLLGRYDADSQIQALDRVICRLERLLDEAIEQKRKLGKVYGMTGIASGLLLAILLF